MQLITLPNHHMYRHPYFRRWSSLVQRCYNPKSTHYRFYGGRGIRVDDIWHPANPLGVKNFLSWLDQEVTIFWHQHPTETQRKIEVARRDVTKNYAPENCLIRFVGETSCFRRSSVLTAEVVIEMRRYKKRNPDATMSEMALIFNATIENISRAIRGITWGRVDHIEAPLPKYEDRVKQQKQKEIAMID